MCETGPSGPDANPDTRRACPVGPEEGLPNCGTGLVGRLRFVAGELANLWRELGPRHQNRTSQADEAEESKW